VRYVIAACVVVGLAVAIWWFTRGKPEVSKPAAGSAASTATSSPTSSSTSATAKPEHVRQLDPTARKQLREQIATARAKARAAASSSPSSTPGPAEDPDTPLEEAGPTVEALKETPKLMAKCYGDQPPDFRAFARLTILSDPELGAIIDTDNIVDKDGKPIDAKIEECMRDTIDSLALPPMAKPGKLKVHYSFSF
jgi:hypothetical protein